jgi:CheY-like chemotaxis protein
MDAMMPKEGGIKRYRELKTDNDLKDIPVIMISCIAKKTFFHSQKLLSAYIGQTVPEPEAYLEKPPQSEGILHWAESLFGKQE